MSFPSPSDVAQLESIPDNAIPTVRSKNIFLISIKTPLSMGACLSRVPQKPHLKCTPSRLNTLIQGEKPAIRMSLFSTLVKKASLSRGNPERWEWLEVKLWQVTAIKSRAWRIKLVKAAIRWLFIEAENFEGAPFNRKI